MAPSNKRQVIDFLTANGNGTGNNDIKQDGSVTPVIRKYNLPNIAGIDHMKLQQISIFGQDTAVPEADTTFLNLNNTGPAALTNGCEIGIFLESDDSLVESFMASALLVAKNTGDFLKSGWEYVEEPFTVGDSAVVVRRVFNVPYIVRKGQYVGVKIQDDLTDFTAAHASILARLD